MLERITVPLDIPFYTQGVTPESWEAEGYRSLEEGLHWADRSCGIASTRMAVDGIRLARGLPPCPRQGELVRQGDARGAYRPGVGWVHQGLAELAAEWGVRAQARREGTAEDVFREIAAGRPCVVSITPRFAAPGRDGAPLRKGGHLAVVFGAETENGAPRRFLVRHPSCFPEYDWPEYTVELERFAASFSGNYLVFEP